jgi:hypothetical protein
MACQHMSDVIHYHRQIHARYFLSRYKYRVDQGVGVYYDSIEIRTLDIFGGMVQCGVKHFRQFIMDLHYFLFRLDGILIEFHHEMLVNSPFFVLFFFKFGE